MRRALTLLVLAVWLATGAAWAANTTKHKFVSPKPDGPDPTLVRPSNWNDEHAFTGGSNGQVLVRDSGQSDGASWTSTLALTGLSVSGAISSLTVTSLTVTTLTLTSLAAPLTVANGGTGFGSYTIGDLLYASGTGALSKLAAVADGNVLRSAGTGTAPTWGKVRISGGTTDITGTLPATSGGTGQASYATGDLLYADSTTTLARRAVGSNGALAYVSSGLPQWLAPGSSGQALVMSGGAPAWGSAITGHGQVLLTRSGSNLQLCPRNGNRLIINGLVESVPSGCVTLGTGSLSASTGYHIYAYMNAGTMTLEASTTGRVTDTSTGVEIKSGDATRTYVGQWATDGGTAWITTLAEGNSWFPDTTLRVLARDVGNPIKTVTNTTTETSLWSTIPIIRGGTLGTNRTLRITIFGDMKNNTGVNAQTPTWRFKYGSTTVFTSGWNDGNFDTGANRLPWKYVVEIVGAGATNAQTGLLFQALHYFGGSTGVADGATPRSYSGRSHIGSRTDSVAAVDSTADQTLDITGQFSSANTNFELRPFSILVELIGAP